MADGTRMHRPCCRPPSGAYGLVIMLDGSTPLLDDGWVDSANTHCFVVAWPRTNSSAAVVQFTHSLLANSAPWIDEARVFLAAEGDSAAAAFELAMVGPDALFSGFATAAGLPPAGSACVPQVPRPLLHMHGSNDGIVPAAGRPAYDGVLTTLGAMQAAGGACRAVAGEWQSLGESSRQRSGSSTTLATGSLPWLHGPSLGALLSPVRAGRANASAARSAEASAASAAMEQPKCELRATCAGGADVVRCIGAFGHAWPPWAAEVAWRFFEYSASRVHHPQPGPRPLIRWWGHHDSPTRTPRCNASAFAVAAARELASSAEAHAAAEQPWSADAEPWPCRLATTAAPWTPPPSAPSPPPGRHARTPAATARPLLLLHSYPKLLAALVLAASTVAATCWLAARHRRRRRRLRPSMPPTKWSASAQRRGARQRSEERVEMTHVPPLEGAGHAQIGGACLPSVVAVDDAHGVGEEED